MCQKLCGNASTTHEGTREGTPPEGGEPVKPESSRRDFLSAGAALLGAAGLSAVSTPAQAQDAESQSDGERGSGPPRDCGAPGRRCCARC